MWGFLLPARIDIFGLLREALPDSDEFSLNEAAGILLRSQSYEATRSLVQAAVRAQYRPNPTPADWYGPYIRDFFGDNAVFEWEGHTYRIPYTISASNDVTLGKPVEVQIAYTDVTATEAQDAEVGEFVTLSEAAKGGTASVRVIAAGWGSSGYYSPELLKRDGPKVFTEGTKMFWNHPTKSESVERPERSLSDLAGVLTGPAVWQESGKSGPGLYAPIKVTSKYAPAVKELAPHIGVSIRAQAKVSQGTAEGRKGPIVESLINAHSVDFVTAPGAGGRIAELFESARTAPTEESPMADDQPTNPANVNEAASAQIAQLSETVRQQAEELARMRTRNLIAEARVVAAPILSAARLPDAARTRLSESLITNPPATEGGDLDRAAFTTAVNEAITAEQQYLYSVGAPGSGRVTGMGDSKPSEGRMASESTTDMAESFRVLGLSESEAKIAAAGRS